MGHFYWTRLTQKKFELYYFSEHFKRCVKINRIINILCAIASSSSIAAWATWQQLSFYWGAIIVISQLIIAINEILPYQSRIKILSDLSAELTPIYYDMEKSWYRVANGSLPEDKIYDICYAYLKQWNAIEEKYFRDDCLPISEKCKSEAEKQKNNYFKSNFDLEEE